MKKRIFLMPVLMVIIMGISAFTSGTKQQKSIDDYNADLTRIQTQIRASYNSIATNGANQAFTILRENLVSFAIFANNVDSVSNLSNALGFIADEFDELAVSYVELAGMTSGIETNATAELAKIVEAKEECHAILLQINQEVADLVEDSSEFVTLIQLFPDNPQYPIDLAATTSILNSKRSIQHSFVLADNKIGELTIEITEFYNSLLTLLYALNWNGEVYATAAESIRLRQTVLALEEGLEDLEDLDSLTDNIVNSWNTVNGIVDDIDGLGGK